MHRGHRRIIQGLETGMVRDPARTAAAGMRLSGQAAPGAAGGHPAECLPGQAFTRRRPLPIGHRRRPTATCRPDMNPTAAVRQGMGRNRDTGRITITGGTLRPTPVRPATCRWN